MTCFKSLAELERKTGPRSGLGRASRKRIRRLCLIKLAVLGHL